MFDKSPMLATALWVASASAATLGSYNADPASVSVSGLSAGGFMSAQLGVAHSSLFQEGFGVFAGGPFDCARNQQYSMCMNNNNPSITQPLANMKSWSGNQIDSTSNLANRKIYLQVGSADTTVGPNPMKALQSELSNFGTSSNTQFITTNGAAHVFPTDFDSSGNNQCGIAGSPYISNCGYDGAGAVLKWMYGNLQSRNTGTLTGSTISFDQTGSYGSSGMATTGYLYVPAACKDGKTTCKLHVALHGCLQSYGQIGSKFIDNTGYNKWADTNNIIVLYPQATTDYTSRQIWVGSLSNPNACFDWVGWYGNNADQKGGVQMVAITNMVRQIIKNYAPGGGSTTTAGTTFITSTTTVPTTTTSVSATPSPLAPLYGQCAGAGWTGPTQCAQGTCTSYSSQYGQCLP